MLCVKLSKCVEAGESDDSIPDAMKDHVFKQVADFTVYNKSRFTFEKLIRRFAELSNETAGEHFTPERSNQVDG